MLPGSFSRLRSLKHLEMQNCTKLESLPERFGYLTNLQHLRLSGCRSLIIPQKILGNILTLANVDFSYCDKLEVIPTQITGQASLQEFYLQNTGLKELPTEIGELGNLKVLKFGSPFLTTLLPSIWTLSGLTKLDFCLCTGLKCLTQSAGSDDITTAAGVQYLGGGFKQMNVLEYLSMCYCPLGHVIPFTSLPGKVEEEEPGLVLLPKIKHLSLVGMEISNISISEYVSPNLKRLDLSPNDRLVDVEALPETLESLSLEKCRVLKRIIGLSHLVKLSVLDISGCWELEELPNFAHLAFLEVFLETHNADDCWKVK